jgi:hypothetical protein
MVGFSLALRANDSMFTFVKGVYNFSQSSIVNRVTKLLGEKWKKLEEEEKRRETGIRSNGVDSQILNVLCLVTSSGIYLRLLHFRKKKVIELTVLWKTS